MKNLNGFKLAVMASIIMPIVLVNGFAFSMSREEQALHKHRWNLYNGWTTLAVGLFIGKKTCQHWAKSSDCKKQLLRTARVFHRMSIVFAIPLLDTLVNSDGLFGAQFRNIIHIASRKMTWGMAQKRVNEEFAHNNFS